MGSAAISRGSTAGRGKSPQLGRAVHGAVPLVARHLVGLAELSERVDDVLAGGGHRHDLVERAHEEQVLALLAQQLLVVVAGKWSTCLRMHSLLASLSLSLSLLISSSASRRRPAGRLATTGRAPVRAQRDAAQSIDR